LKLDIEKSELSTIIASLGKSSRYFEQVAKDQETANWLIRIRHKLVEQGEKQGVFNSFFTA